MALSNSRPLRPQQQRPRARYVSPEYYYTHDGRRIPLSSMPTQYLINAIKSMRRRLRRLEAELFERNLPR